VGSWYVPLTNIANNSWRYSPSHVNVFTGRVDGYSYQQEVWVADYGPNLPQVTGYSYAPGGTPSVTIVHARATATSKCTQNRSFVGYSGGPLACYYEWS